MTHEATDYVIIDGHHVDAALVDMFYDMRTGERITDEQWDESKRRVVLAEALEADDGIA